MRSPPKNGLNSIDEEKALSGGKWKRGAQVNPPNRFESITAEPDLADFAADPESLGSDSRLKTQVLYDYSKSILASNDSPDIPFTFSVNPYRGCEHGCSYCYARPTHETLGMNAGLDFESKIMVKPEAPALLRAALEKRSWKPQPIAFSGVTDCYQPLERRFRLTRACLEVLAEFRNPAVIITKNILVLRDLDILRRMADLHIVQVLVSVTTLDHDLAQKMEPRTSLPQQRLEAVARLAASGIPVGVLMAPVIPGLTDAEIPAVLKASAQAGACSAGFAALRLPLSVKPVFLSWLETHYPEKAARVIARVREIRGGSMNESGFGSRMRGEGEYALMTAKTFRLFARRYGLDGAIGILDCSGFRVPGKPHQPPLFPDIDD